MSKICRVIINADDFGLTDSCTDAIKDAFLYGIVSDVSLVANGNAFEKATAYADKWEKLKEHTGIHFNLTEGKPLSKEMQSNARFVTNGSLMIFLKNRFPTLHCYQRTIKWLSTRNFRRRPGVWKMPGYLYYMRTPTTIYIRDAVSVIFFLRYVMNMELKQCAHTAA